MFFSSVFSPVKPENDICFFEKSIIQNLSNFKVNVSLFNKKGTKNLMIPITCKKAHIHDTGFIAQLAELLIYVIPFKKKK